MAANASSVSAQASGSMRARPAGGAGRADVELLTFGINARPCELIWRARAGRSHEQLLPVGERQVPAIRAARPVLGLIAVHFYLGPRHQRLLGEPAPEE